MVRLDMTAPVQGRFPAGDYLCEVKDAQASESAKGDDMVKLKFVGVYDHKLEVRDNIMFGGDGWGMGRSKLTALGVVPEFTGDLDPYDLIQRRVWLSLAEDTYTDKRTGKTFTNLKPDKTRGPYNGYWPESAPPPGAVAAPAAVDDSETPF